MRKIKHETEVITVPVQGSRGSPRLCSLCEKHLQTLHKLTNCIVEAYFLFPWWPEIRLSHDTTTKINRNAALSHVNSRS